jgi:hypothetical protein
VSGDGVVEAEEEGGAGAQGDEYGHVGTAVAQDDGGVAVELPPGAELDGNGNRQLEVGVGEQGNVPVEKV